MKIHDYKEYGTKVIALENIKCGDIIKIVRHKYARPVKNSKDADTARCGGFAMDNYKKGQEVKDISLIGEVEV